MLASLRKHVDRYIPADARPMRQRVHPLVLTVAVGVAYFVAARLSLLLMTQPGVAVFWPAAGVASGTLIALGRTARWPVAVGVIAATITTNLMGDRGILSSIIFSLSDAGESLLVAWIIERYVGSDFSLGRLNHVLVFLMAAIIGTMVSGIGGTLGYKLGYDPDSPVWTVWRQWVASDAIGIIAVAPLIIGVVAALREPPSRRELVEAALVLMAQAAIAGVIIFVLPAGWWEKTVPVVLLFPAVLWLAARCRPVCAAAGVFIVSFMIVATATFEIGNFGDRIPSMDDDIVSAQITIVGTALSAFILSALFSERRQYEERQQFLLAELDHRAKNLLARVAAVADATRQSANSTDDFIRSFNGRIQSMATAHDLLSQSGWSGADLAALVRNQLAPHGTDANVTIAGTDIRLSAPSTQALGMVLHELVTNAVKYGALSIPGGRVSVSWKRKPSGRAATNLILAWHEVGGPPVASMGRSSYGTDLIRDLIPYELGGTVDLVFAAEGVKCRIEIPIQ